MLMSLQNVVKNSWGIIQKNLVRDDIKTRTRIAVPPKEFIFLELGDCQNDFRYIITKWNEL